MAHCVSFLCRNLSILNKKNIKKKTYLVNTTNESDMVWQKGNANYKIKIQVLMTMAIKLHKTVLLLTSL